MRINSLRFGYAKINEGLFVYMLISAGQILTKCYPFPLGRVVQQPPLSRGESHTPALFNGLKHSTFGAHHY